METESSVAQATRGSVVVNATKSVLCSSSLKMNLMVSNSFSGVYVHAIDDVICKVHEESVATGVGESVLTELQGALWRSQALARQMLHLSETCNGSEFLIGEESSNATVRSDQASSGVPHINTVRFEHITKPVSRLVLELQQGSGAAAAAPIVSHLHSSADFDPGLMVKYCRSQSTGLY